MNRKALPALLALILAALAVTTVVTGETIFIVPGLLLLGVIAFMAVTEFGLHRRLERRHDGSPERAIADHTDPVPGTHLASDHETPLGDTPEAHDEVSPHDLPVDHPGRRAAEEQAGPRFERERDDAGVTQGDR